MNGVGFVNKIIKSMLIPIIHVRIINHQKIWINNKDKRKNMNITIDYLQWI